MEITQIADKIEEKIKLLEQTRPKLKKYGEDKAMTISLYERELALTIVRLRNNAIEEWEGMSVKDLPASITEKTAKGMCSDFSLEVEKADAGYRSLITYIQTVESELNAYQSIFRHLSEK